MLCSNPVEYILLLNVPLLRGKQTEPMLPTISMFFGIIVALFYEDTGRRRKPLIADWELAVAGEEPFRIPPLQ